MFVCVCKAISDRQIRRAVREDGVTSLRELARVKGLGTCCGKCVPHARELLDEELGACTSHAAHAANSLPLTALAG